jgi:hypothetical protein
MTDNKSSTKTGIPTNVVSFTRPVEEEISKLVDELESNPLPPGKQMVDGKCFGEWSETPTQRITDLPESQVIGTPQFKSAFVKDGTKPKSFDETKKVMTNFHKSMATYPKYISHEGSTVLCVLLSMEPNPSIRMEGLPVSDGNILRQSIPENLLEKDFDDIRVAFDEQKDFIVTFLEKDVVLHTIRLFNTVIHPQNIHVPTSVVDIEDGDKISIGGKVVMDKNAVKKLIGFKPELAPKKEEEKDEPRRQQVTGRNAFEIRTDIMQMALDWATKNGKPNMTPDEVVNIAKKFYTFVENKRY